MNYYRAFTGKSFDNSAINLLIIWTSIILVLSSCKKDDTPAPLTNTQLLTQHTWQLYETVQQIGGVQTSYKMNGINTTGSDYSRVRLVFKTDGSGLLTDPLNNKYTLTWKFDRNDESKMTVVINYPAPATLNYTLIYLDENTFSNTLFYSESGQQVLASSKYIPVP
ncbi:MULTISPECIES: hypothetical protein [unclassified Spirosoma]|uniref:hypothetical protein n=1 Tax=unclassified Spirosoma TaxID=2621999 RepID=UPI00095F1A51|nr:MULTISPECIES: hypothetical protein [unclassified Spirosoma]MBN8825036.1 hypothetical protein [Spirosoma sp.]OJW73329.1 MAG: hypothetical protein BGO59_07585 [Spirosoma sp. 48-14]